MIKIEKLVGPTKAVFTRNGVAIPVFVGQLMSYEEAKTIEVFTGEVLYSIDESELVTIKATPTAPTQPTIAVLKEIKAIEVAPALAPIIVKPAPRAKK